MEKPRVMKIQMKITPYIYKYHKYTIIILINAAESILYFKGRSASQEIPCNSWYPKRL